ncbi:glycoside hydrolase domain-containing protein [Lentzea sp. NBRC 102530]|uniref:glycoside hydrolase domain-containing protein n=1 Tax=Lentzea sp. NBRC 102530 TaxID=3032201 RepID=UPI0024A55D35|nr:glycoside hydrolase domain-containing protein [Lentzea sp. NBRC 102530]GLY55178.1 hypothetical protein Lesp01_88330 [Lentzea sp. NBRC 102530]
MSALTLLAYGADWSARPIYGDRLTQSVNRANGARFPVEFVLRYANFKGQGLSYLDRSEYQSHLAAGKRSYLIFQKYTNDPAGGAAAGRAYGAEAVAYARYLGYQAGDPIFFTADGWAASKGYSVETGLAFFAEATRVVREAGFLGGVYGFADIVLSAHDRGIGDVYWLCGDRVNLKRPNGEAVGIHLYQWNNGRVHIESSPGVWVECDLVEQYEVIGDDMPSAQEIAEAVWAYRAQVLVGESDQVNADGKPVWDTSMVNAVASMWGQMFNASGVYGPSLVDPVSVSLTDEQAAQLAASFGASFADILTRLPEQTAAAVLASLGLRRLAEHG